MRVNSISPSVSAYSTQRNEVPPQVPTQTQSFKARATICRLRNSVHKCQRANEIIEDAKDSKLFKVLSEAVYEQARKNPVTEETKNALAAVDYFKTYKNPIRFSYSNVSGDDISCLYANRAHFEKKVSKPRVFRSDMSLDGSSFYARKNNRGSIHDRDIVNLFKTVIVDAYKRMKLNSK